MFIYLVVFFFSALLFYCSSKIENKSIKFVLIALAILIPSVLAGVRGETVGTDVALYGKPHFERAMSANSFFKYFKQYSGNILSEPLYHTLVYNLSRYFDNYHWALFSYELLTVGFAYLGMRRCNKLFNTPLWLGMLLYYLAMYNVSLNAMRQSIAVSIGFFAATYLFERKYIKYGLFSLMAIGFHTSAIISLIFLPMYILLKQENISQKKKAVRVSIFILLIMIVLLFGNTILNLMVQLSIIKPSVLLYLNGEEWASYGLQYFSLLMHLIYIVFYVIHYRYQKKYSLKLDGGIKIQRAEKVFFLMICIITFLTMFGSVISAFITRMSYYFIPFQTVAMANILNCYSKKSKIIWCSIIILYALFAWYMFFVIRSNGQTIPYIFDISK